MIPTEANTYRTTAEGIRATVFYTKCEIGYSGPSSTPVTSHPPPSNLDAP